MRAKLKLDLEALDVDTFDIGGGTGRGTVEARAGTDYTACWGLCPGGPSQPVLICTQNGCYNTMNCDTYETACEGRSCQLSCGSCNGSCEGETCVGITCGNGETCVDHVCNYSEPPYCWG